MAEQKKSKVGLIILIVVGVVCLIGIGCVAIGWYIGGDTGMSLVEMTQKMQAEFGVGTQFQQIQRGPQDIVLAFGVPSEADRSPEAIAETQDRMYRIYAAAFHKGNYPFATALAVGKPSGSATRPAVTEWESNIATLDELAERTGVPRPPSGLFEGLVKKDDD